MLFIQFVVLDSLGDIKIKIFEIKCDRSRLNIQYFYFKFVTGDQIDLVNFSVSDFVRAKSTNFYLSFDT